MKSWAFCRHHPITSSPHHLITESSTETSASSHVYHCTMQSKQTVLRAACLSGSAASVTSTMALALCGEAEDGAPAGPINGPSQWLWGEAEAYCRKPTWRHTVTGYGIHHAMSVLWATLYESLHRSERDLKPARICAEAAVVSALAYCVDYHVAPRRLRPGFKKHLGPRSIFAVYAAFGVGLAAVTLLGKRAKQ